MPRAGSISKQIAAWKPLPDPEQYSDMGRLGWQGFWIHQRDDHYPTSTCKVPQAAMRRAFIQPMHARIAFGVVLLILWVLFQLVIGIRFGLIGECHADDLAIAVGRTVRYSHDAAFDATYTWSNVRQNLDLRAAVTVLDDGQAALQGIIAQRYGPISLGLGAALTQRNDDFNHGYAQAVLEVTITRGPVRLSYRHWSNGNTSYPNLGRDILLLSWGFK